MEYTFDTLCDAISFAFRQEQTSLLSLDKICEVLSKPDLFVNSKTQGLIPCSTIARRRISSTLSSSDLFVRAGPPRTCLWAIRPNNPTFISDGAIAASIEQMLTSKGPMTTEQFVETTDLTGAHKPLFDRFLSEHQDEFVQHENGTWWFINQPLPLRKDFDNLCHAILSAFEPFQEGATVEEIHRYLCLSSVAGKLITRRSISRELSRRTDVFLHLSRAKYGILPSRRTYPPHQPQNYPQFNAYVPPPPPPPPPRNFIPIPQIMGITNHSQNFFAIDDTNLVEDDHQDSEQKSIFEDPIRFHHEDEFDPDSFFGSEFNFEI